MTTHYSTKISANILITQHKYIIIWKHSHYISTSITPFLPAFCCILQWYGLQQTYNGSLSVSQHGNRRNVVSSVNSGHRQIWQHRTWGSVDIFPIFNSTFGSSTQGVSSRPLDSTLRSRISKFFSFNLFNIEWMTALHSWDSFSFWLSVSFCGIRSFQSSRTRDDLLERNIKVSEFPCSVTLR